VDSEEPAALDLPVGPTCPECRRSVSRDDNFCPYCGRPLRAETPEPPASPQPEILLKSRIAILGEVVGGIGRYTVLSLLIVAFLYVAILIWSLTQVLPSIGSYRTYLYIITPWIVNIAELGGPYFAAYYVFIVCAILASFAFLINKSARSFIAELAFRPLPEGHSPLYVLGTLYFAALSFNLVYYLVLGLLGINPTVPSTNEQDLWKILYSYARAGVWEEIVARLLLIGIPLLAVHSITRKREGWKKYLFGGGFKIGRAEVIFLLLSSAVFATAHVFTWDAYKILPTFVGGLAFGYLFLRFGLYAAVMIHFIWDFLSVPLLVFPGVTSTILIGLLMIAWVAVGVVYFISYSSKIVGFALGRKVWPDSIAVEVASSTPDPRQHGTGVAPNAPGWGTGGGFQFVCKYCGNTEARYKDGGFECTRCGRRS
jgi:hypothetical protein